MQRTRPTAERLGVLPDFLNSPKGLCEWAWALLFQRCGRACVPVRDAGQGGLPAVVDAEPACPEGPMRSLLFLNLIAIVVLAGALGRMYEGEPLPWMKTVATAPARPAPPAPSPAKMPVLRVLTEGAYPPFSFRDADGRLRGFDVDIAEALCARLERRCEIEARGWNDLLVALSRSEADAVVASMLISSPGRAAPGADERIVFTKKYYSTPGRFAARKTNTGTSGSAAAIAGKQIAVEAKSVHEAFLARRFPAATIVAVRGLDEAKTMLAQGRVDFLFADRNALLRWLMEEGEGACCRLIGVDYADPAYFGAGAGIAVRAEDEALRGEIDRALAALVADGTHADISRRYFGQSIR